MDYQKAIKVLKENYPKTCKIVDGRYEGGFYDLECDLGKAITTAIQALEKQIQKKPTLEGDGYDNNGNIIYDTWICPNCEERYEVDYDDYDFCPHCGQAIDTTNENEIFDELN